MSHVDVVWYKRVRQVQLYGIQEYFPAYNKDDDP